MKPCSSPKRLLRLLAITGASYLLWCIISKYLIRRIYTLNNQYSEYFHPVKTLLASDYKTLMDIGDFHFLTLHECHSDLLLLVFVHSAPTNFLQRESVRETWGGRRHDVKVVFMLGRVQEPTLYRWLREENTRHGDIVEGSFVDSYRNMTYKHVMGLKYAVYHCPGAKYVLKVDDDVFVNIPVMMELLKSELSPYGCANLMMCTPRFNPPVNRRGKWEVSFDEYNQRFYPDCCEGWAVLYSPDVVFKLYKHAQNADYFWIDDVFMTGIVANKAEVSFTSIEDRVLPYDDFKMMLTSKVSIPKDFLYGPCDLTVEEVYMLWDFTNGKLKTT